MSAIARRTGVDRKTVREYIQAGLEPPHYGPRRPRPTLLDTHYAYLRERVATYPDLSVRPLLRERRGFGLRHPGVRQACPTPINGRRSVLNTGIEVAPFSWTVCRLADYAGIIAASRMAS